MHPVGSCCTVTRKFLEKLIVAQLCLHFSVLSGNRRIPFRLSEYTWRWQNWSLETLKTAQRRTAEDGIPETVSSLPGSLNPPNSGHPKHYFSHEISSCVICRHGDLDRTLGLQFVSCEAECSSSLTSERHTEVVCCFWLYLVTDTYIWWRTLKISGGHLNLVADT